MEFRFCPGCATPLTAIADGPDAGLPGCPDGHYVHYANPAVTAFAFIEAGEFPDDAIRREIAEETGLEVLDLEVFGAWTSRYGEGGKWTVDIAYRCRRGAGAFVLSQEKSQAAWLPLEDFPLPAFDGERHALQALRALG
jgi:ADP-ribose pyrophosphatase YjhB (NUDIX family)